MSTPEHSLEPGLPAPDRIPNELIEQYGDEARRRVRRSRGRGSGRFLRPVATPIPLKPSWREAFSVVLWLFVVLGFLAGVGFVVYRWSWIGLYILLPLAMLLAASLFLMARLDPGHEASHGRA